jgi:outer membrane protein assembly factor BamA
MWMGSLQYTTKSQLLILVRNNIYTKNNRFFLSGDWRFQKYSQDTYGLGTNAPQGGLVDYQYHLMGLQTNMDSLAQPMKFNFLRLYQTLSIKLTEGLYAGIGYNLDYFFNIVDEKLSLDPENFLLTSHFLYNTYYDFPTDEYFFSSVNLCLQYDTRDNMLNAYEGVYAKVSWRGGSKILGNDYAASMFNLEWRSFHGVSKRNPRHLVAFWVLANFSKAGKIPYMILPATAYDQRSRSARGYTQGRYRGANYFYTEAEYRFPISKPGGILGGVVFLNATSADYKELDLKLFESIKPGYGVGLRIKVDKQSRTNLAIDIGLGHRSAGFYLAASEVF